MPLPEIELLTIRAVDDLLVKEPGKSCMVGGLLWTSEAPSERGRAVFPLGEEPGDQLEVTLSSTNGVPADDMIQALANNGQVLFSGRVDGSAPIALRAVQTPLRATKLDADVLHWRVVAGEKTLVELGATPLEIFWVGVDPDRPGLHSKGLSLSILATLSEAIADNVFPAEVNGVHPLTWSVAALANWIFNRVPPRYDIWQGAPHFISYSSFNSITLHYNAYLNAINNPNAILNCYDTASVAQYLLKSYGYQPTLWLYMNPFGYLRYTNLIGRGYCNNPFYGNGGLPVVGQQNPSRTAFGNHAFVGYANAIVDACAGPHTGNENLTQYIGNATDDVYPIPPRVPRGTPNNVTYWVGVTHTNFIQSAVSTPEFDGVPELIKLLGVAPATPPRFVVGQWPLPTESTSIGDGWELMHDEIVPGHSEVLRIWTMTRGEQLVSVKLFVASDDTEYSFNRFLTLGTAFQNPDAAFERGPESLGQHCLIHRNPQYARCIWRFRNAVLEIINHDPDIEVTELAQFYADWAADHLVDDIASHLPPPAEVSFSREYVDEVEVTLVADDDSLLLDVDDPEGVYRLTATEPGRLRMRRRSDSDSNSHALVIDKSTLLVRSSPIE